MSLLKEVTASDDERNCQEEIFQIDSRAGSEPQMDRPHFCISTFIIVIMCFGTTFKNTHRLMHFKDKCGNFAYNDFFTVIFKLPYL